MAIIRIVVNVFSYQFSYQLPLVSASWLRCACGSEWREHEAFVSLVKYSPPCCLNHGSIWFFKLFIVLLFTHVSSLSLFQLQVSTTRCVEKYFRTFSLQCCLRMVREWPLQSVTVRSWKKSSRFTPSRSCALSWILRLIKVADLQSNMKKNIFRFCFKFDREIHNTQLHGMMRAFCCIYFIISVPCVGIRHLGPYACRPDSSPIRRYHLSGG